MKIVITSQVLENYAAHDWDGKGECPQHWKCKFGYTYIVSNVDIALAKDGNFWDKLSDQVEVSDDYFHEYILHSDLVDDIDFDISNYCEDWEKPIELTVEEELV